MTFEIKRGQITKMRLDAIVNAANSQLQGGGGVCGAIFQDAGWDKMQKACDKIGYCAPGNAVLTPGFALPAKYVIHTVGPIWQGGQHHEAEILRSCYRSSLTLAMEKGISSIAFPLIASGIYGFPKDQALQIAVNEISTFVMDHEMQVFLIIFTSQEWYLNPTMLSNVRRYIDSSYKPEITENRNIQIDDEEKVLCAPCPDRMASMPQAVPRNLRDLLNQREETFSQSLLRLIDEKGKSDVEVYKKANMDRKLFSKIRSNKNYAPKKSTVLALAVALELNLDESKDLLAKAGFAFSDCSKFDLIVRFFIEHKQYNIFEINEVLFSFDQPLLSQ